MRLFSKNGLGLVLTMVAFLLSSHVLAHDKSPAEKTSVEQKEPVVEVPDLGEFIPLATKLPGRLAALENKITGVLDISQIERNFAKIEENLKEPASQLELLKDSEKIRLGRFISLGEKVENKKDLFEKTGSTLKKAIRKLGKWRKEWLAEKKDWSAWQSSLLEEGDLDQVKSVFEEANDTIDKALALIRANVGVMLSAQEKASDLEKKIDVLAVQIDGLILGKRRDSILQKSPPIFSSYYFSQFRGELWYAVWEGLGQISWPRWNLFARIGWVIFIQVFISLLVIIAINRKREAIKGSKHWRFMALRPFSAGLFSGTMAVLWIYAYQGIPETLNLAIEVVALISFARLIEALVETPWKRQFVYGLVIVFIVTGLIYVINLPFPLVRIYTILASLAGILFCWRWANESKRHKDPNFYPWSLRLISFYLAYVIIAQILGKKAVAELLFTSLIRSMLLVIMVILFMYVIRRSLEWLFRDSPLRRATVLSSDSEAMIRRATFIVDVAIWGLIVLPVFLVFWGVYDSFGKSMKGLLALGFNLGSQRISVGLGFGAAGIFYGSFLISWFLQKLLLEKVLLRRQAEMGVRIAVGRLVHYGLIMIGFLVALSTLGFEITKLTIILSALGVGIGFGLQGVVNNFVSGLILLFERPIRIGDIIEMGGNWAEVKRIGLRSTTVQTFDQADVIIPNADLVTNQVTNWTLSNRQVRLIVPVGVAYGSDVPRVEETLLACASENPLVMKEPAPHALFLSFGESSLDFELRLWVRDAGHRMRARSELHHEIERRFREAKIEIAFPQRDLHLRSVDESIGFQSQSTA